MVDRVWTVRDALDWTVGYLEDKGIDQPRLSAEWLLSAATNLSRVELYTQFARPLDPVERATFREGVKRRAAGQPLQYVTGEMPFRHIVLRVRPGVFIPRPETEVLVDVALDHLKRNPTDAPVILDLCTGSGAVALSLAHEVPAARVIATEISPDAAAVARENAIRLGLQDRVEIFEGDLFDPVRGTHPELLGGVDLVLSNPPYIPSDDVPDLPIDVVGYEPHLALDGGPDGLDVARRIAAEAPDWLVSGGLLAMELDEGRVESAVKELARWYEGVRSVADLAGRDRIAAGTRR